MAFISDGTIPQPTSNASSPPTYPAPSQSDLAAVAVTVSIVGILMAILVTWLILRLRRASQIQSYSIPISTRHTSYTFRPSFAPSEASSKFGFTRKPLHLSHKQDDTSWDFADRDPFAHAKESDTPHRTPSSKHRPTPLPPVPAYTPRAKRTSTYKDASGLRTPTTPATPDFIDPPPPAYCRESGSWPVSQPNLSS